MSIGIGWCIIIGIFLFLLVVGFGIFLFLLGVGFGICLMIRDIIDE